MKTIWLKDRAWLAALTVGGIAALLIALSMSSFADIWVLGVHRFDADFWTWIGVGAGLGLGLGLRDTITMTGEFMRHRGASPQSALAATTKWILVVFAVWAVVPLVASMLLELTGSRAWSLLGAIDLSLVVDYWVLGFAGLSACAAVWFGATLPRSLPERIGAGAVVGFAVVVLGIVASAAGTGPWIAFHLVSAAALLAVMRLNANHVYDPDRPARTVVRRGSGVVIAASAAISVSVGFAAIQDEVLDGLHRAYPRPVLTESGKVELARLIRNPSYTGAGGTESYWVTHAVGEDHVATGRLVDRVDEWLLSPGHAFGHYRIDIERPKGSLLADREYDERYLAALRGGKLRIVWRRTRWSDRFDGCVVVGKGPDQAPLGRRARIIDDAGSDSGDRGVVWVLDDDELWRLRQGEESLQRVLLPNGARVERILNVDEPADPSGRLRHLTANRLVFASGGGEAYLLAEDIEPVPEGVTLPAQKDDDVARRVRGLVQVVDGGDFLEPIMEWPVSADSDSVRTHHFQIQTLEEHAWATLLCTLAALRPPGLALASLVDTSIPELTDPLVQARPTNLVFVLLVAGAGAWFLRRVLHRRGVDVRTLRFWTLVALAAGPITILPALCFETRRAHNEVPRVPTPAPRIKTVDAA